MPGYALWNRDCTRVVGFANIEGVPPSLLAVGAASLNGMVA